MQKKVSVGGKNKELKSRVFRRRYLEIKTTTHIADIQVRIKSKVILDIFVGSFQEKLVGVWCVIQCLPSKYSKIN